MPADPLIARPEILQAADAVAREKSLDREEVLAAMESAYQRAARARFGSERDIRAKIDRKTGAVRLTRVMEVVEDEDPRWIGSETEKPLSQERALRLSEAKRRAPNLSAGDLIVEPVSEAGLDFGRVAARNARQVIIQEVRAAERRNHYNEYKDRVGEIINGIVRRVEFSGTVVEIGKAEAMLPRREAIPGEQFNPGDRVRAYIYDVKEDAKGPQVFISRAHPGFLAKLFSQEVPEIYDGVVEIKAVARDPGSRAKIAVSSRDSSIDPVGTCIGSRGARVRPVVDELKGERVDILHWTPDPAQMIIQALKPAEVSRLLLDEDEGRAEVVIPDDQLSLAIGKRGQNVRLAAQLTKWELQLTTESEQSKKSQEEMRTRTAHFVEALNCDDMLAALLVTEGFTDAEMLANTPTEDLLSIGDIDEDLAHELLQRAADYMQRQEEKFDERRRELGVEDAIGEVTGLPPAHLVKLGEAGIKTLDDLGDLASDELIEILGQGVLDEETANAVIMAARAHWFEAAEDEAAE